MVLFRLAGLGLKFEFELAAKAAKLDFSRFAALLQFDLFELLARLEIDLLLSLHDTIESIGDRKVNEVVKCSRHDNQSEVHRDENLCERVPSLPYRVFLQPI